jgi:hypothetical protein
MIFAAQATIEFIGIILFTTQVGKGPATSRPVTGSATAPAAGVVAIMPPMPGGVEPHVAVMAFPSEALVGNVVNWPLTTLASQDLSYVRFAPGDQISFETNVTNNSVPGAPTHLRHLKPDWETANHQSGYDLDAGYKPPYASAVAVIRLTEGTVDGCKSKAHPGRMDTVATFQSGSVLTVRNADGSKHFQLRVSGYDVFVIAHVPETYIQTGVASGNHFMAYCRMANRPLETCPVPNPVEAVDCPVITNMPILQPTTDQLTSGDMHGMTMSQATSSGVTGFAGSADCSNTQWP